MKLPRSHTFLEKIPTFHHKKLGILLFNVQATEERFIIARFYELSETRCKIRISTKDFGCGKVMITQKE